MFPSVGKNAANNLINKMVWLKYLQVPHAVPEVQGKRVQEQANSDGVHPQEEGREDEDKDAQVRLVKLGSAITGPKAIKIRKNLTQNKSQTQRTRAYKVMSF